MWDRRAPLAGACFAVLAAICAFLLPTASAPKASDSGDTFVSYITNHHHALLWHGYLTGIAFLFFLWFVTAFSHRLQGLGESQLASMMYAGGLVSACIAMLKAAVITFFAWQGAGAFDSNTVKALVNAPTFAYAFPWALFVGAAYFASWRARLLPEYLNVFGCLLALWILVIGAAYSHSGFFSPGGWFGGIALIAFLVCTFLTGLWLARNPEGMAAHAPRMMRHEPAMHH